ncbi:MAG: tetratricopeptide repeat protein [Deltaproteobacteria bacterium]|nr:tetratricopeptide repeat protein [Deltaproteobacteria bacterium]MBW2414636.1 tetratricopeptide repeat protein [Deltaproteobacteria bacterium]
MKHLKSEPDDANARLKLGDLHLKRGDPAAAIEAYAQVASQFSKGGFDAKAVAIFKQILRIDAKDLSAHVSLGDHFQRMGLNKDALREFQEAVQICKDVGQKRQALDLLKRVSALDPANVPNRLSLADLFVREKMLDEARQEFESLLREVEGESDGESLARVSQQMIESFPDDEAPYLAYASAQLKLGEPAEAVAKLSGALAAFPESIPMRNALVEVHEALGDAASAQSMHREIAELYKRRGDHDMAREVLQRHVPIEAFGDEDADSSPSLILSDVAEPDPPAPPASEEPLEIEPTSHAPPAPKPKPAAPPAPAPKVAKAPKPAPEPVTSRLDELVAEARVALEFGDPDGARATLEQLLSLYPDCPEGLELLAKLDGDSAGAPEYEEFTEEAGFDSLPDIELVLEDEDTGEDDAYTSIEPPPELELIETVPGESTSVTTEAAVAKLEKANHLFEQGEFDEAENLYRAIIEFSPNHPQAMLRLGEIEARRGGAPDGLEEVQAVPTAVGLDLEVSIDEGLEVDFEPEELLPIEEPDLDGPVSTEAPEPEPAPEAEPVKPAPVAVEPEVEAEPEVDEEPESLIDADYFADVLNDDDEDPPSQDSFDLAAELGGEGGASEEDFQQVFDAFKKGVQEQLGEGESEAHYDLAIAYKEMGLLDDAIEQLEVVRRSGEMQIESLSLMAMCKLELGRPQEAAGHLSEALAASGDGDDAVVSLRYDLGEALVAAGKHGEALEAFQKVAALDENFREVRQRIAGLSG